jgi:hypothetical protein
MLGRHGPNDKRIAEPAGAFYSPLVALRLAAFTRISLVFPIALVLLLFVACGSDDDDSSDSGTNASPGSMIDSSAACTEDDGRSVVYGADAGDYLADRFSLATGDFNGDSVGDLLIGAPLADGPENARENAGEAYIVLGNEDRTSSLDLAQEPGIVLYGEAAGDNFGFTVAAGDVDGDGIDDALVGARFAASGLGKAYAFSGRSDLSGAFDSAEGQQQLTISGKRSGDFLGIALAAGDVNGDDTDDLLMGASGAPGPNGDREQSGEVDIVFGSADLPDVIELSQQAPDFTIFGAHAQDFLPNHLSSGDVDGDGRDEVLIGTPFAENGDTTREDAGEAYIVPVPDGGTSLDLATRRDFTAITGADPADALGFYVASGDINDDDKADVIVGIRNADGPDNQRTNAGEVQVLFGSDDLPESLDLQANDLDVRVLGAASGDTLGFTVASGDVDGDDRQDLLMGSPLAAGCPGPGGEGGKADVLLAAQEIESSVDLAESSADVSVLGRDTGDQLGFSLASVDFDGDGKADVIAGALQADSVDNGREDAGETVVTFGD